jgi:hypothetical protein
VPILFVERHTTPEEIMFDLPAGYDAWRTYCPTQDAPDHEVECDECGATSEALDAGDECEDCDGTMQHREPAEPCRCPGDRCYC